MPYGIVHLKAKKHWQKGRTIISYFKSHFGTLRAASTAITTVILRLLLPSHITLHAINDDLVGFFNSVPQNRLLDAVTSLTTKWNPTYDTPTLTIDILAAGNPIQLSHIGQHHRRHPTQRTIDTEDIPTIEKASNRHVEQGLGPNSHLPCAMSPLPSSNTPGLNCTTA